MERDDDKDLPVGFQLKVRHILILLMSALAFIEIISDSGVLVAERLENGKE